MGTHQVVVTASGQAAVERTLTRLAAEVEKAREALEQAEARRDRFKTYYESLDAADRERFLAPFLEIEEALEDNTEEAVI